MALLDWIIILFAFVLVASVVITVIRGLLHVAIRIAIVAIVVLGVFFVYQAYTSETIGGEKVTGFVSLAEQEAKQLATQAQQASNLNQSDVVSRR